MIGKVPAWLTAARVLTLALWLVITFFPLYWILVTSLKHPGMIATWPIEYWPSEPTFLNYSSLFENADFGVYIINSTVVSGASAAVATLIAILSGYVLARFQFVGKAALVIAFLITQMIPAFIALGPLYVMLDSFGLVDSRTGLALVYVAMCIPFSSIMLRGFFANIPDTLEEAAMLDGCSRVGALFRIILPVMAPGIAAAFVFNFVNCWNELFLSVTLINSDANRTIPTALNGFISSFNIEWGPMSAAAVLAVIPTMILFAFASRHIVAGLTSGAVKS